MRTIGQTILVLAVSMASQGFTFPQESGSCIPGKPETAMRPGMVIEAKTRYGQFRIEAGSVQELEGHKEFERTFLWGNGCRVKSSLGERRTRWYGSCGIYSGALAVWPYYLPKYYWSKWTGCNGTIRVVTDDKQLNFPTVKAFLEYFPKDNWTDTVYRNDGHAVQVAEPNEGRMQINIDVIQVLIQGKKPTSLPGADDGSITINEGK